MSKKILEEICLVKKKNDNHSLFQDVFTNSPISMALVGLDGTLININKALCQTLGYTHKELLEMKFDEITYSDDLKLHYELATIIEKSLTSYQAEKRYIQKNGNVIWASINMSLVFDEQENPEYLIYQLIDISDQKTKEQRSFEIEELYNLISCNALDIISCSTPDGILRYISPSIRDVLGYEPEELIGKKNDEINHPEDIKKMQSNLYSDRDVFTFRSLHKKGYYLWFETTNKIIRDAKGDIQKIVSISRDITERKNKEDVLAEAERISHLGSWEMNFISDKLYFSEELYQIFKIDKNKCLSKDLLFLIHPDDQQRFSESISKSLKGENFSSEFKNLQPDGTIRYLQVKVKVTFDDNGSPIKMNGTTQDITHRKIVEFKLKETIERYTSLKKYNHDAIISLDLNGSIINTNSMAEKITGYSVDEMIGVNISKFIGIDNLTNLLSKQLDTFSVERHIDNIKHKNGHRVEVLTSIAPIIVNSENVGFYIIAKDITDQKELLIAKESAENTNKAKSEFLAMMSHEIRTPMNGVLGLTDLLLDTNLNSEQKEFVEMISKSGNTLLSIINDILDFSKIELGKTDLVESPFNVKDIITEAVEIVSVKALEKNLNITVSVSSKVPRILIGDSVRLKQIILNLISNAVKFTYSGGIDIIVNRNSNKNEKIELQFTVKDTGIGIPLEMQAHLFQPFSQLDNFMTRKTEGTGLGLAISKKLVSLMEGNIWIEPTDGSGTSFVFTASFLADEENLLDSEHFEEVTQDTLKILIAEDNQINQVVLNKMIEKLGHNVSVVENGNDVIHSVAYQTYDIIFMDVQMPIMNGVEATKVLRNTLSDDKCPFIVAVTANALQGDREKYLALGMDEYISKPIKSNVVSEVILNFIKSKKS
jgi:PAS domain S-box-containing protein